MADISQLDVQILIAREQGLETYLWNFWELGVKHSDPDPS